MNREQADRTGATTGPYTLQEAELLHELTGRWPQSRVPVERYLDPGFARTFSGEIGAAAVQRVPEGHPLLPLVEAVVRAGCRSNRT